MSKPRHSLRVDSFEDRVVPASMNSVAHSANFHSANHSNTETFGVWVRPNSVVTLREANSGETYRVTSSYDYPVYVRFIAWSGNWNTSTSTPSNSPSSPSAPSNTDVDPSSMPSTGTGPVANPQSASSSGRSTPSVSQALQQNNTPSISVPVSETAKDAATQAAASAAAAAANYAPAATQLVTFNPRTDTGRDWTTPAPTYLEGVDLPTEPLPVPAQTEEPPLIEPAPAQNDAVAIATETVGRQESAITAMPTAGIIPFSLTALQDGVRGILEQAAALEVSLSDDVSSTENYLWFGAAALVVGGALQTAWGRQSRSSDPRTLGLDSVLVRWGERNAA